MLKFILIWIFSFIIACILTAIIYALYQKHQQYSEEHPSEKDLRRRKKQDEEFKKEYNAYKIGKQALISIYGPIAKDFYIGSIDLNKSIFFFEKSKRIWLLGHNIPYESILAVTEEDKDSGVTDTIYKTKANNTNMAKRALVGGIVAGVPGAVIGATTSSKSTTSTSYKRYAGKKVEILLDDIDVPSLTILDDKFRIYYDAVGGRYDEEFEKFCSILKAISIKNQSSSTIITKRKVDDDHEMSVIKDKIESLCVNKQVSKTKMISEHNSILKNVSSSVDKKTTVDSSEKIPHQVKEQPKEHLASNNQDSKLNVGRNNIKDKEVNDNFEVIDLPLS